MFWQHFALQDRALRVERAKLFFRDAVHSRSLRTPTARKDARPTHNTIWIDAVDPDPELTELGREQPHLMRLVGFGCAIRDVVRTSEHRVLAGDVDDVAATTLCLHHLRRRT